MILVSHNITLSPLQLSDAGVIVEYMRDKKIYNNTILIPFPYHIEHAQTWLEDNLIFEEENGFCRNYAIRNQTGTMIGAVGMHFNYGFNAKKTELGYWLAKAWWGQGIMSAVVKKMCDVAREQHKLETLEAHVFSANNASQKVLLNAGFTETNRLPGHYNKDGKKLDAVKFMRVL